MNTLLTPTTSTNAMTPTSKIPYYSGIVLFIIMLLLPMVMNDFLIAQISLFSCYGLLAMSLSLIWGQVGLLCLGQAMFFGIGAYAMGMASLDMIPLVHYAPQSIGFILALVTPMLFAYLISLLLFNGRQLDGAYLGLVTLAMAVMLERFLENWNYVGGSNGLFNIEPLQLQGTALSEMGVYYVTLGSVIAIAIALYYYKYVYCGLILKAIRGNETRAKHLGVNTKKVKTTTFVLSAGIAGIAGALFATQLLFVSPDLVGFALSTEVLIWVAVGGRYSFTAAFLGAIFIRLLENQLGDNFKQYWQLALGCIFIIVVLYFPKGIFGKAFK